VHGPLICSAAAPDVLTVSGPIAAATDPDHPDHAEAAAEFDRFFGNNLDREVLSTPPFDIDEINSALARLGFGRPRPRRG